MDNHGFDLWADTYDESVLKCDGDNDYPFAGYYKALDAVYHAVAKAGVRTLLDVGIGTGLLAKRMADAGVVVTGIDSAAKMLAKARDRVPGIRLIQHDIATGLPNALDGQLFNGIISTYALHHFSDSAKCRLIRSMFARLSPGGILAIADVSFETIESREQCRLINQNNWDENEDYFAYDELGQLLHLPTSYVQISHCAGLLILRKPRVVFFNYSGVLVKESPFHGERGIKALLQNVKGNPSVLTANDIYAYAQKLSGDFSTLQMTHAIEIQYQTYQKVLFDLLGITFSLTALEMEHVFFENAAPSKLLSGIRTLLDVLCAQGIRSGIIANTPYSGEALSMRLRALLPEHTFDVIVPSGEYLYRMPKEILFKIALRKANVSADDAWYCGHDFSADIEGADAAGLCPIWYTDDLAEHIAPARLKLSNWDELTASFM